MKSCCPRNQWVICSCHPEPYFTPGNWAKLSCEGRGRVPSSYIHHTYVMMYIMHDMSSCIIPLVAVRSLPLHQTCWFQHLRSRKFSCNISIKVFIYIKTIVLSDLYFKWNNTYFLLFSLLALVDFNKCNILVILWRRNPEHIIKSRKAVLVRKW